LEALAYIYALYKTANKDLQSQGCTLTSVSYKENSLRDSPWNESYKINSLRDLP